MSYIEMFLQILSILLQLPNRKNRFLAIGLHTAEWFLIFGYIVCSAIISSFI